MARITQARLLNLGGLVRWMPWKPLTPRQTVGRTVPLSAKEEPVDLAAISNTRGVSIDVLRPFAKISDPKNGSLFSAEAAQKAFSGAKV